MAAGWCQSCSLSFLTSFAREMLLVFYCRSQKTSQFQKQSGLNAQLSGMSLTGLAAGPVVGFSLNPRTILKFKNELALKHTNYVCEQVKKALEVNLPCTAHLHVYIGPPKIQEGNVLET